MNDQSSSPIKSPVCTVHPMYFTVTCVLILSITYGPWHLSWEIRLWFEPFQVIADCLNYASHQDILQKRIHLPYLEMDGVTFWRELSVCYRHVGNAHQRKYSVLCTNVQLKTFQHIMWFLSLDTAGGLWYRCCILETAFLVLFRALIETLRSLSLLAPGKCCSTFCGVQLSHTRESCPFKCTISHCKKPLSLRSRNPKVVASSSSKKI